MALFACSTQSAPTPTPQPDPLIPTPTVSSGGGCFLDGHAVLCRDFKFHVHAETVTDLDGLDCDGVVAVVALRLSGWRAAESTGRVTYDEGANAGQAIIDAVHRLGCGKSRAWLSYLASLPEPADTPTK